MRPTTTIRTALTAVLVAVGVITALVAPATATTTSQAPHTTVKRVTLLTKAGHLRPRYTVARTRKGRCWTSSMENGRLYRCFTGNLIHDPCWKESGRRSVVCLSTPWSTEVVRIRLTRKLPARDTYGPRLWGLRVGDGIGVRCTASQGAGGVVDGRPISYYCRHDWVLLGRPDRSAPLWRVGTAKWVTDHYEPRGAHHLTAAWKPVVH